MKKLMLFVLAISFLAVGCKNDDDNSNTLRHDGDNNSAPILEADVYKSAARFTSSITSSFSGLKLVEVEFYILDKPETCAVIIYGEGTGSEPGPMLYSQDVKTSINSSSWNSHVLTTPIDITGDDLWISIEVTHNESIRSVGCDNGPAISNGDWIFSNANNQWETLRSFTDGFVDINWNIRGIVSEE